MGSSTHIANKNDAAAIKKIKEHAEAAANKAVHGCYARHSPDDPAVQKLRDEYINGVRRNIYQRTKACDDKAPSKMKGDFCVLGGRDNPQLRCASKPVKFDIPSTWLTKEVCKHGEDEEWNPKDLGL